MYKVSCGAQGCNPSWPLEPGAPGMSHMHAVCILLCGWIAIVPWLAVWLCCDCCGFMACRVAPRPPEVEPLCTVAEASWGHLPGGAGAALKGLTGEGGMGRVGPQENAGVGHMVLASWWRVTEMLPASTEPDGGRRGKKKKKKMALASAFNPGENSTRSLPPQHSPPSCSGNLLQHMTQVPLTFSCLCAGTQSKWVCVCTL